MRRGTCFAYTQAVFGINSDDGLIFDTSAATSLGLRSTEGIVARNRRADLTAAYGASVRR